jgi:hypothetical protein
VKYCYAVGVLALLAACGLALWRPWAPKPPTGALGVKAWGAIGDGKADDTDAIQQAIAAAPPEGVVFPRGEYRITKTIEVSLGESGPTSLLGQGGVARIIMAGPGPAFRFVGSHQGTAEPASVKQAVRQKERMPQVVGLEIVGDHPEADGLEFTHTMQPTLSRVLIREVRHGIRLTARNRNLLIDACHVYNCRGVGIFLDHVNLHQAIIQGCHISYCKGGGVKVFDGEVRNLQITGNDIEYNYDSQAKESADLWIDVRQGSVREGTVTGNTIQAKFSPGGANLRFSGPQDVNKVSLFTVAGNHISNQEVNIHLKNCRGVVLTGNSIALSRRRNILVERGRHIVIGPHSLDHNPDYKQPTTDGITLRDCDGCILNGLLLEGAQGGDEKQGGAIEAYNCRETTITGCVVLDPRYRGIYARDCRNTSVVGCTVLDRLKSKTFREAVRIVGRSGKTVLEEGVLAGVKFGE